MKSERKGQSQPSESLRPGETAVTIVTLRGAPKPLGYRVPAALTDQVAVGSLARVPLRNRTVAGLVTELAPPLDYPITKLKYLLGLEQPFPVLTPELIDLAEWVATYYACPRETVFEALIPGPVRRGMRRKTERFLRLARSPDTEDLENLAKRAPKQRKLLDFLAQQANAVPRTKILERLKIGASSCDALVEKGFVEETHVVADRTAYAGDSDLGEEVVPRKIVLNPAQENAVTCLRERITAGGFAVELLHGVTGSGKTEVYLAALETVLASGGGVLFLVPEVALAPQTVGRIRQRLQRLGQDVVVWHSHLSDGERLDAWEALASGKSRVVVGARSAIFAPVRDLRLLIVDEEHEPAYKQEEAPRYHARDLAIVRAQKLGALCVLGSATPSLESHYNVQRGKYGKIELPDRVDDRSLPLVHMVDMRREGRSGEGPGLFSRMLVEKTRERLEKREQVILFLNRRGYSTSLICPQCSEVLTCPHCSTPLVHHRVDRHIRCHLCGHTAGVPNRCPSCHSKEAHWRGFGTQRIEEVVAQLFPRAKAMRIDADTMQKRHLFRQILQDFRTGKLDILIGTQMIAKGLDFPNVTLVGLLDADLALHVPDFRAEERSFQLMVQVAGRSGRGDLAGEVVVQTYLPHSPPLQYGRRADTTGFVEEALAQRKEYGYPPFRHLVQHVFRGRNAEKVQFVAESWVKRVENEVPEIELRGPAPAPIEKIRDHYRFQVWYLVGAIRPFLRQIEALQRDFPLGDDVTATLDVDAQSLS